MQIPTWWLVISAVFFIVNIVLFIGLMVAGFFLLKFLRELGPRLDGLSKRVDDLHGRVIELTESLRKNIEGVGGKARGIVGSVERVAQSTSRQFERFSPFFIGALTAMRLVKALNEFRKGRPLASATKKGVLDRKPATKNTPPPRIGPFRLRPWAVTLLDWRRKKG